MPIFKIEKSKLIPVGEKPINLERDIQRLTEANLETTFGLKFISSEFNIQSFYIDTLAFDPVSKAFIIIEYKKDRSFSVIDQGYAYLAAMINNKADFILEYNEKMNSSLKRGDVDWSQSKVIFIADSFTPYQQNAIAFRDLPIELWEITLYDNKTVLYNQLKSPEAKESIKVISKSKMIEKVSREVKVYSLEDLLKANWTHSKNLLKILEEAIFSLEPKTERKITKFYIAYLKPGGKSFVEIVPQKQGLKIYLRPHIHELRAQKIKLIDCSKVGHWTNGITRFNFVAENQLDETIDLVKQVHNLTNHAQQKNQ